LILNEQSETEADMNNSTQKNKVNQIKKHKEELLNNAGNLSLNKILSSEACQTIIVE